LLNRKLEMLKIMILETISRTLEQRKPMRVTGVPIALIVIRKINLRSKKEDKGSWALMVDLVTLRHLEEMMNHKKKMIIWKSKKNH